MYYVSSESHVDQSGSYDKLRMTVVIRDTADKGFKIECPWQCLLCRLKAAGINEQDLAGVDFTRYSYTRVLRPLSSVEVSLIRCLGKPEMVEKDIGWSGRCCTWIGTWHFLDQSRHGQSLSSMLFTGLDSNMKTTRFPLVVRESEVAVAVLNDYGIACAVVYPVVDYQGLCSALTKYNVFRPQLPKLRRIDITYGPKKTCPKEVTSCDLCFRGDKER